jgi:poly(hydroxyalkanoate) depolymerase family esterase
MNHDFQRLMAQATRLTRSGDLQAATAAIQAALREAVPGGGVAPAVTGEIVDAIELADVPYRGTAGAAPAPARAAPPAAPPRAASGMQTAHHASAHGGRDYKLYVPPQAGSRPLPLVVMLHGCTQDAEDFAAGTAMNDAARLQGFFVLYPEQSAQANPQRCWNWFKHSHQQRGRGEPALLAGMVAEVMAAQAIDPARVYVAGLSAGGAMAAILGQTYPDLYAAVGVHSGLAAGAATDLPGALAAMSRGQAPAGAGTGGVPTIVFHGDADTLVHPDNGHHVAAASAGTEGAARASSERVQAAGRRASTRRRHHAADGRLLAEHWLVHGAPHAWSGGTGHGSCTDPLGPDATAEMLRFFFEHPRPAVP